MIVATCLIVFTVLFVFWLERQTIPWLQKILNWLPAILFAYVVPAGFTHAFRLDLSGVYWHTLSRDWIMPLAVILVMSALSFRQLKAVGVRPIILFVAGSAVIAVLPFLLVLTTDFIAPDLYTTLVDEGFWRGLVPIVGGWIGGSTSQLVLKEIVACPEALFLMVLVIDNVLVNIWMILMFQMIRRSDQLNRRMGIRDEFPDFIDESAQVQGGVNSIAITLGITTAGVLAAHWLIPSFLWKIIALSVIGLALGNWVKDWNHRLVLKLGSVLIVMIMAILGLKLDFSEFALPAGFLVLAVAWLLLHYAFMMVVARLLKLHMAWLPIASMANLGGISTAPAVTAAYNAQWMPHAILLAILSMVTGTAWGLVTISLFSLIV